MISEEVFVKMTFSLLILAFLATFISTASNNELVYASYDSIHDLNRQEIEVVNNLVKSLPNKDRIGPTTRDFSVTFSIYQSSVAGIAPSC